jgi:hypothetical protein
MPCFTTELSCTDGSTDASIFFTFGSSDAPLKRGSYLSSLLAAASSENLIFPGCHAHAHTSPPSPPPANSRVPVPPP